MDGFYNNTSKKEQLKERPIIFSVPMVKAILDGHKTQTRRVVRPPMEILANGMLVRPDGYGGRFGPYPCPYGRTCDRLWVRETWVWNPELDRLCECKTPEHCYYRADGEICAQLEDPEGFTGWKSPRFMPRWASRITLEITNVRVERLQDISEEDSVAEGSRLPVCELPKSCQQGCFSERTQFSRIWDSINGKKHPWESNPWVWVIEFKPLNTSMNESDNYAI